MPAPTHMTTRLAISALATTGRDLRAEVTAATVGDPCLQTSSQCGTRGRPCPWATDTDRTPRMLFTMVRAGMRRR